MPIIKNLSEISDVYIGSEKITDIYAGNDKVKSGQQELPWTQPKLSANGTIGGNAFACIGNGEYSSDTKGYKAFDKSTSTYWYGLRGNLPYYLEWYNPVALKISQIIFTTGTARSDVEYCTKDYEIQASNDGNSWISIYSGTNTKRAHKTPVTVNL